MKALPQAMGTATSNLNGWRVCMCRHSNHMGVKKYLDAWVYSRAMSQNLRRIKRRVRLWRSLKSCLCDSKLHPWIQAVPLEGFLSRNIRLEVIFSNVLWVHWGLGEVLPGNFTSIVASFLRAEVFQALNQRGSSKD